MICRDPVVRLHSVAEAYFYLMAASCASCRHAPLKPDGELTRTADEAAPWQLASTCASCSNRHTFAFTIHPPPTRESAQSDVVNATVEPSRAIDLLGWLTLFQTVLAAAERQADRATARQLAREAGLCLDEALKFYRGVTELPEDAAFFTEGSLRHFRENSDWYRQPIWRDRRSVMADLERGKKLGGRRWWQFWKK